MTRKLQLPQRPYNLDRLDFDLKAALPSIYLGFNSAPGGVFAVIEDSATADNEAQIVTIATNHNPAQPSPEQQTIANIKSTAQSAAGVALTDLTAAQVKSLLAVVLYRLGGVTNDGKVRPLSEWAG